MATTVDLRKVVQMVVHHFKLHGIVLVAIALEIATMEQHIFVQIYVLLVKRYAHQMTIK